MGWAIQGHHWSLSIKDHRYVMGHLNIHKIGMPDQNLNFICHIKQSFEIKVWIKTFPQQHCYCNVNMNEVMGIGNETKNVLHFWKITISLKNWHFLTYFTKQDTITPGQVLEIAKVSCFIMIPFQQVLVAYLSDCIGAKVTLYIYEMPTLCASLILN